MLCQVVSLCMRLQKEAGHVTMLTWIFKPGRWGGCLSSGAKACLPTQQDHFLKVSLRKTSWSKLYSVDPNSGQELKYCQQLRLSLFLFWSYPCPPLSADHHGSSTFSFSSFPSRKWIGFFFFFWISPSSQVKFLIKQPPMYHFIRVCINIIISLKISSVILSLKSRKEGLLSAFLHD